MDPARAAVVKLGMEISRLGMNAGMDPHDLIRYGLARLAAIAGRAGLGCKVRVERDHTAILALDDDIRAKTRDYAERN
jgi:hypothetical protein